jgi:hypothetical protein
LLAKPVCASYSPDLGALLYFIEYQSGGIEGRFPPSLYPRRDTVE